MLSTGIQVLGLQYVSSGKVRATIKVDPNAELGPRRISVQNESGGAATQTKLGLFSIYDRLNNAILDAVPRWTWEIYE